MFPFIFASTTVVVSIGVLVLFRLLPHFSSLNTTRRIHYTHSKQYRTREALKTRKDNNESPPFWLCAVSLLVMIYVINLCNQCSCVLIHLFRDLQYLFVLVNSASNQFLYAWRIRSFREAFQTIPAVQWITRKISENRVHVLKGGTEGPSNKFESVKPVRHHANWC